MKEAYMEWLAEEFKIRCPQQWYLIQPIQIKRKGGYEFLEFYGGLLTRALFTLYPEFPWQPTLVFWDNVENHRVYLNWYAEVHGIKKWEDWYKHSAEEFLQNGGTTLLVKYGYSLIRYHIIEKMRIQTKIGRALRIIYPEYPWQPWKFDRSPRNYWKEVSNIKTYCKWLAEKLDVFTLEDADLVGTAVIHAKILLLNFFSKRKYVDFMEEDFFRE
jgi:hypothetical protein